MAYIDFLSDLHTRTQRDYLGRVNAFPKAQAAAKAKKFDFDYWDGDRNFGYGGMKYDGRWRKVADALAAHYRLKPGQKVLDIGCGKGFLLYDLTQAVPGIQVAGIDISSYAIEHAREEVKPFLQVANATHLPYPDQHFDLVISITTLHNLYCHELDLALRQMQRVAKQGGGEYLVVESYRNEQEKANLLYWQLTCEMFCTPREWQWWFDHCGYTGDHSFIYFE